MRSQLFSDFDKYMRHVSRNSTLYSFGSNGMTTKSAYDVARHRAVRLAVQDMIKRVSEHENGADALQHVQETEQTVKP